MKPKKIVNSKINAPRKKEVILDFSFCAIKDMGYILETMLSREDLMNDDDYQPVTLEKTNSRSLLLNNNSLSEISHLPITLSTVLVNPNILEWLDLSFNNISLLPKDVFQPLSSLKILYLHGNKIDRIETVYNLRVLDGTLLKLTIHGNPIKDIKNYRLVLISIMSHVRELDFSLVSEAEREVARAILKPRKKAHV